MIDLHEGDCLEIMPTLPDASVDCVISDPPYPMIKRDYGMMTEAAWLDMMQEVVRQTRRILKPTGSAVFILQPNSEKVGKMRLWLWEFIVWAGREWGIVQDAYWWNFTALPVGGAITDGLMRGSIKACIWIGNPDCYRNQSAVLWEESARSIANRNNYRFEKRNRPSGRIVNGDKARGAALRNEGTTPFNLLPIPNSDGHSSAAAYGHGAGTPLRLADWWIRYICPPGGVVGDWFAGTSTMGIAALQNGCLFVGIEKMAKYAEVSRQRLAEAAMQPQLSEAAD